jgi:diguanylate cyclase (GGDEF)-like protein
MRTDQVGARQLGAVQLRVLLTLSRELFQTDEASSSLGLIGRALVEMIQPDSALLLVRGDRLDIVGFDSRGAARPAGTDHPLYQTGIAVLSGASPDADDKPGGDQQREDVGARTLAVAVPAHAAVATLVAGWEHDLTAAEREGGKPALSYILELAAAALGKIEARSSLERLVGDQREQIANSSVVHAAELARRDEAATEMRMLSLTDVLTGLYNRRGFFLQAEQIFKVSLRRRAKSAVIFADIDGLKRVNDELGHDAGDRLIRDAAIVFRQSFRQADVVARLGGDEFVAFTLDDEHPEAILERIRANQRAFNLMQERPYSVSISAGVVQCDPGGGQALSHYVLLADEQMYGQKRSRLH